MSLSAEVLARISELNRLVAQDSADTIATPALKRPAKRVGKQLTLSGVESVDDGPADAPPQKSSRLPDGHEILTASGAFWCVQSNLDKLWRGSNRTVKRDGDLMKVCIQSQEKPHPDLAKLASAFPQEAMFLDLETCGFAGSTIFLIGLLHFEAGQLKLTQLLARNYAEEKAILHAMWAIAHECSLLVTFNGKSFDWPCVHDRSTLHRLGRPLEFAACRKPDDPTKEPALEESTTCSMDAQMSPEQKRPELVHCDLLHHSRRKWKDRLPNCKLQTLERHLFGRRRRDDIPGSEIPAAYHQFVRSGDAWEMRSVLHHNALDLITLLQLALKIAE